MQENDIVKTNVDFLLTESTIDRTISLDSLASSLRERKMTGRVEIEFNQGGLRRITVRERTKASGKQRDQIRQALGME